MLSPNFRRLLTSVAKVSKQNASRTLSTSMVVNDFSKYETLSATEVSERVMNVELNRPKVRNAMNMKMFEEMADCFKRLDRDRHIRAVVLSGKDKMFTAGLDLMSFQEKLVNIQSNDVGRRAVEMKHAIEDLQETTQIVGRCKKPIIAAIHNACIGVGVDITSATDIRYCTQDAWFQVKEAELGIVADLGTLQYFPQIVGNDSITRELVFSCRKMDANEALQIGFVGKIFPDYETMKNAAIELAKMIASKTPVAIQGSKICLNQMRDNKINDGLRFTKLWNMSGLQSEDLAKASMAVATKSPPPEFDDM